MMKPEIVEKIKKDTRAFREHTSKCKSKFSDFAKQTFNTLYGNRAVWVIEDDDDWVRSLEKHFSQFQIRVIHKPDIKDIVKALSIFNPFVVVLDRGGIPEFDQIIDTYGQRVIVCTGEPGGVEPYVEGMVLAVYSKDDVEEMVNFIKTQIENESEVA